MKLRNFILLLSFPEIIFLKITRSACFSPFAEKKPTGKGKTGKTFSTP
jgi:hypothetical protein